MSFHDFCWKRSRIEVAAWASCTLLVAAAGCNTRVFASGAGYEGESGSGEEGLEPEDPDVPDESCGNGAIDPGEYCHRAHAQTASGIDPCALAVADFDHDGRPDAAVPNSDFANSGEDAHVANVLLGHGDGTLAAGSAHYAGPPLPVGIDQGDFDGDGDPDVVVANWQANEVDVLLGDGHGGLLSPIGLAVGDAANSVSAGDIDLDGHSDIVVALGTQPSVALIRSFGDGYAPPESIALGATATHAILADMDQDGAPELVATLSYPDEVVVLSGHGDGSFGDVVGFPVNWGPQWVIAADMDGNGIPDLVVANSDGTLDILRGNGAGDYLPAHNVAVGTALQSVTAGDFDMDGLVDLAVSDDSRNQVIVVVATAPGQYEVERAYDVGIRPVSIRSADFNLDGVLDFAVANQLSNTVSVIVSDP